MITYPQTSMGIIITEYLMLAESFNIEKKTTLLMQFLIKFTRNWKFMNNEKHLIEKYLLPLAQNKGLYF